MVKQWVQRNCAASRLSLSSSELSSSVTELVSPGGSLVPGCGDGRLLSASGAGVPPLVRPKETHGQTDCLTVVGGDFSTDRLHKLTNKKLNNQSKLITSNISNGKIYCRWPKDTEMAALHRPFSFTSLSLALCLAFVCACVFVCLCV